MKKSLLNFHLIFLGLFPLFLITSCGTSKKAIVYNDEVEINQHEDVIDSLEIIENGNEDKIIEVKETLNIRKPKGKLDKILVYLGDENVVKWRLVRLNSQNVEDLYENVPLMRFDEPWKQIYGTTGCNKFTAYYTWENTIFNISRLTSTELPCDFDESQFLNAMQSIDEIREEDSILSFYNDGQEILVFERYNQ
ncbi:META domain-containing protein [Apibacter sp. B3889]|uniref:META domain-containing protein n=1 Tax=unclassified Apibacter TaxID=2630820 RepID=UPI001329FDB0|nr:MULTISPECIES: META domain-containing protein [unclassified Apibacter]MXO33616.1 META domain-containing protein [Apibacter sp. B3883]MXO40973.1 META domain-containing protein [Apibacter sp. B3889]MXP04142.1 META domain-containing protein [Apibacter sp. B3887]MXP07047.1 META domain-containing protein [Apibacter sp. B3935]